MNKKIMVLLLTAVSAGSMVQARVNFGIGVAAGPVYGGYGPYGYGYGPYGYSYAPAFGLNFSPGLDAPRTPEESERLAEKDKQNTQSKNIERLKDENNRLDRENKKILKNKRMSESEKNKAIASNKAMITENKTQIDKLYDAISS